MEPDLEGESFTAAGMSLALADACDELIGPGRWTSPVNCGGAVIVRFPSEDRANAGYHIEGGYDGPGSYWVNVRSRGRGPHRGTMPRMIAQPAVQVRERR